MITRLTHAVGHDAWFDEAERYLIEAQRLFVYTRRNEMESGMVTR